MKTQEDMCLLAGEISTDKEFSNLHPETISLTMLIEAGKRTKSKIEEK